MPKENRGQLHAALCTEHVDHFSDHFSGCGVTGGRVCQARMMERQLKHRRVAEQVRFWKEAVV
jgi:hypothetical protein